jgi:hypothetical protein
MISHEHKVVFVHVPKAAGQSVENFFLALLGLDWNIRAPLLLRPRTPLDPRGAPLRLAHLTAEEYIRFHYLSEEIFSSYFSFAFVRNPFSRTVSIYRYMGYDKLCSFPKFVSHYLPGKLWKGRHYYFVRPQCEFTHNSSGRQLVDFIGRFESIDSDFEIVANRLGLKQQKLPYVNSSADASRKPFNTLRRLVMERQLRCPPNFSRWQDYYNDESVKAVSSLYARDFELFGYAHHPFSDEFND